VLCGEFVKDVVNRLVFTHGQYAPHTTAGAVVDNADRISTATDLGPNITATATAVAETH
jgi:hypothetical protein